MIVQCILKPRRDSANSEPPEVRISRDADAIEISIQGEVDRELTFDAEVFIKAVKKLTD